MTLPQPALLAVVSKMEMKRMIFAIIINAALAILNYFLWSVSGNDWSLYSAIFSTSISSMCFGGWLMR